MSQTHSHELNKNDIKLELVSCHESTTIIAKLLSKLV